MCKIFKFQLINCLLIWCLSGFETEQKALCVEGWDEALHEIARLSYETVLSPQNAEALVKSVEEMPVLVIGGVEDALVSVNSSQVMASKLPNSVSLQSSRSFVFLLFTSQ